jgi:hypothetical protein
MKIILPEVCLYMGCLNKPEKSSMFCCKECEKQFKAYQKLTFQILDRLK